MSCNTQNGKKGSKEAPATFCKTVDHCFFSMSTTTPMKKVRSVDFSRFLLASSSAQHKSLHNRFEDDDNDTTDCSAVASSRYDYCKE
jgi:hypothetical protein